MVSATLVEDPRALAEELEWVTGPVGLDLETVGCNPKEETPWGNAIPLLMSLCWRDCAGEPQTFVVKAEDIPVFQPWLEADEYAKVGHNLTHFDRAAFANIGIEFRGIYGDTLVMSRLLDPGAQQHGLKYWGKQLGFDVTTYDDVVKRPRHSTSPKVYKQTRTVNRDGIRYHYTEGAETYEVRFGSYEQMPLEVVWKEYPQRKQQVVDYAAQDALLHLVVFEHLHARLCEVMW